MTPEDTIRRAVVKGYKVRLWVGDAAVYVVVPLWITDDGYFIHMPYGGSGRVPLELVHRAEVVNGEDV